MSNRRPRPGDLRRHTTTPPLPGGLRITPRIGAEALPEAVVCRPADLAGAWAAAWAYTEGHAKGIRWSPRGVAWAAFQAIADAVDGPACGPDTLHGQDALSLINYAAGRQP